MELGQGQRFQSENGIRFGRFYVGYDRKGDRIGTPIYEMDQTLTCQKKETAKLIPENPKVHEKLFTEYLRLCDYFGGSENNVMKTFKKIKAEVKHAAR